MSEKISKNISGKILDDIPKRTKKYIRKNFKKIYLKKIQHI